MAKSLTPDELRKMTPADLQKEIIEKRSLVGKLRLTVKMGKEKATHLLPRERKLLAQMLTILAELQRKGSSPTLPIPKR